MPAKAENLKDSVFAFGYPSALETSGEGDAFKAPAEFVWMPAGETKISAGGGIDGEGFSGAVLCDEQAAKAISDSFTNLSADGRRIWIDYNHEAAEAAAWVKGFRWEPARGIVCAVEWTPGGTESLAAKEYFSFSPAFLIDRETMRPRSLIPGESAGGLVNAPAFGARMPALVAARLGRTSLSPEPSGQSASPGNGGNSNTAPIMSDKVKAAEADEKKTAAAAPAADEPTLKDVLAAVKDIGARVDAMETAKAAAGEEKKPEAGGDEKKVEARAKSGAPLAPEVLEVKASEKEKDAEIKIGGLSLSDAIKAYSKETDSRQRGVIYAREIAPGYKAKTITGHDIMRVLAANSLGSLAGNLVAQQYLTLLKYELPILDRISTDFSPLNAHYGQTVITRTRGVPSTGSYVPGTGYVAQSATTTDVSVAINSHVYTQVAFSANDLASTSRDLFGEQIEGMHYALGLKMVNDLYALITTSAFTNSTTQASATAVSRQDLQNVHRDLNLRGVPQVKRSLLINSTPFATLFSDAGILQLAAYQRPGVIEKGDLLNIAGFDLIEAPNLPTTNFNGIGFTPDALVIATRVPNDYTQALPGAAYGNISTVTNPDTGLSLQSVQYVNHDAGTANWRLALMYGVAVGQADSGQLLVG